MTSGSSPTYNNVTFSNNTLANGGGIDKGFGSPTPTYKHVLLWNTTDVAANGANGVVIAGVDPFVNSSNPKGADGIPRTADDGLRIAAGASAVINQGVTGAGIPTLDILGLARVGNPEPGAYEFVPPPLPANVIAVDKDAMGANNGSTWADAYTTVQTALSAATAGKEIWIAEGTYKPLSNATNSAFQLKSAIRCI